MSGAIRINVGILGRPAGTIVDERDIYYDTFKSWAENENRHLGLVACTFCDVPPEETEPDEATDEYPEPEDEISEEAETGEIRLGTDGEPSKAEESSVVAQKPKPKRKTKKRSPRKRTPKKK